MSCKAELLLTSSTGENQNISLWNGDSGTFLASYYGGGHCPTHGLTICGGSIIATEKAKPLLHSWQFNKQQPDENRLLCPGKASVIDCSPDFCHLAVGVQNNLHLYQISSGRLLSIGTKHFQPLLVVKFSGDCTLIGCGGEDGLITIWNISRMASRKNCTEPILTISEHSLPVNDILFTTGGPRGRIISVSGDRTCKIHDISTNTLLLTLVFEVRLTSTALSLSERDLFIGNGDGTIHNISLCYPPRNQNVHCSSENITTNFVGHTKAVSCLSCSLNNNILFSGSLDGTVKVWHIRSGQCLRTISHKGPVLNVLAFIPQKNIFDQSFQITPKIHNFSLSTDPEKEVIIDILHESGTYEHSDVNKIFLKDNNKNQKIDQLQSINYEIYKFALDNILGKKLSFQVKDSSSHFLKIGVPKLKRKTRLSRINKKKKKKSNK